MKIYRIALPIPFENEVYENIKSDEDELGPYGYYDQYGADKLDKRYSREKVDYIQSKFPNAKPIGNGAFGIAYDIGDNKVLKITTDSSEISIANSLKNKSNPAYVKVYDVNREYSYIILEKVTPLNTEEMRVFDFFVDMDKELDGDVCGIYDDDLIDEIGYFEPYGDVEKATKEDILLMSQKFLISQVESYCSFLLKLKKNMVTTYDLHGKNVGKRINGEICILDLGT